MSQKARFWLVVLCAALTGLFIAREPWQKYRETKAKAAQTEASVKQMEAERAQLLREKAEAESSLGREKMARERNFVKDGEVRIGN